MDNTIKPPPDPTAAVLATARETRAQVIHFLDELRKQSVVGDKPWAIIVGPETLQDLVTALTYAHVCETVARPNTHVSAEDIDNFFRYQTDTFGGHFFRLRKPALYAELYGVPFIAAQNIPRGVLCPVPAAASNVVTLVDVPIKEGPPNNGATATGVGEEGPGPA